MCLKNQGHNYDLDWAVLHVATGYQITQTYN